MRFPDLKEYKIGSSCSAVLKISIDFYFWHYHYFQSLARHLDMLNFISCSIFNYWIFLNVYFYTQLYKEKMSKELLHQGISFLSIFSNFLSHSCYLSVPWHALFSWTRWGDHARIDRIQWLEFDFPLHLFKN